MSLKAVSRFSDLEKEINLRVVPVRLKFEEAKKIYKYQKAMLNFAYKQYIKSKGTDKEEFMHRMYLDAIQDYKLFRAQYEKRV